MDSSAIVAAMMRLGAESLRAHMLIDRRLALRHGFSVALRGGLWCFSSTKLNDGVFNHVSGYATFGSATQRAIDRVRRHYDALGATPSIPGSSPTTASAEKLRDEGFRTRLEVHIYSAD